MVSGYAIKGLADALDKRDENILIQKKLDLEEQDRRDAKNAKVMDFLNQFGVNYKNSNDSKNSSKKKADVLSRLKNSFGKDSEIYTSLLAGGSLENLQDAEKIINEARERVEKVGGTFTPEDAADAFAFYKSEVIENENPITVEQLVERFGVDPDAELSGTGMTYEEAFQRVADKLNQDTYVIGMRGKTPLTEFNPQDLLSFNKLYVENASAAIDAEVTRLNEEKRQEEISRGETPSGLPIDNISEYNSLKTQYDNAIMQEKFDNIEKERVEVAKKQQASQQQAAQQAEIKSHVMSNYGMSESETNDFMQKMSDPTSITIDNLVQLYRLQNGNSTKGNEGPSPAFQQTKNAQQVPSPMGVMPSGQTNNDGRSLEDKIMDTMVGNFNSKNPWK